MRSPRGDRHVAVAVNRHACVEVLHWALLAHNDGFIRPHGRTRSRRARRARGTRRAPRGRGHRVREARGRVAEGDARTRSTAKQVAS